jgi:predicted short-subunit dehydrogenase-like oxidoreductase (DUF2520 family)
MAIDALMHQLPRPEPGGSLRVNVIGAGNVGRTFMALVDAASETALGDVLSRRPDTADAAVRALGAGRSAAALAEMRPADLWVLAVPDDRIAQAAHDLAHAQPVPQSFATVIHCSGFLSSEALAPLRDKGWAVASCHPVLSFSDPDTALRRFPGTCCAIEGDAAAADLVAGFVTAIQGVPFGIDPAKKPLYHAAAVFSNNFATVLQAIAREAWAEAGVAPDMADRLGNALLAGVADGVARLGPAAALTGPAARGDDAVLRRQAAAVADWHPDAATVYAAMSRMARRLKTTGTTQATDTDESVNDR